MAGPAVGGVFLSYRREETSHLAGRVADRLVDRFGAARVFMDVDSIEPGLDFAEAIRRAVDRSDVLLAVIGAEWLAVVDGQGRPRLEDPEDFVVQEVHAGLAHENTRVIPVLVDGATMPAAGELPTSLAAMRPTERGDGDRVRASTACGPGADEFDGAAVDPAWEVHDGANVLVDDGRLEITASDGADVRADLLGEVTAPWVSRGVSGSFSAETSVTVDPRFTYQGAGLLLYRDGGNYVRLERGFGDTDAIVLEYAADGRHLKVHGPFAGENLVGETATSVKLRLERRQASVTASWRPAGSASWQELGGGASLDGDAQVGVAVLNRSQPPEGDPQRRPLTAAFDDVRIACQAQE